MSIRVIKYQYLTTHPEESSFCSLLSRKKKLASTFPVPGFVKLMLLSAGANAIYA
ncbi:unnamed protein product [Larinioides sclopetarius]|uniref:Uncharacterized protein n=1 Tax=Larinioides sclopetarius TaxID=280406 RepID=A0AAV1ZA20_9ARAC